MSEIISWDVLDNEDDENFNFVNFVNATFPSQTSQNEIETALFAVRNRITQLDMEMSDAVHRQSVSRVYRSEYFDGGLKNGLQYVETRYTWLKRTIRSLERRQAVFPPCWSLQAHLSWEFCDQTRKDLEILLKRESAAGGTLNVRQLIQALFITIEFENELDIYVQSLQIEVDYMDNEDQLNEFDNNDSNIQKRTGQDKIMKELQIIQQDSDSKLEDQSSTVDRRAELLWKNILDRARNILRLNNINSRNEEDKRLKKENIKQQENDNNEYGELGRIQSHSASDINPQRLKGKDQRLTDEKRKQFEQKHNAHQISLVQAQEAKNTSALVPPFVPQFHGIISSCFQPFIA
ncbi:MAG: hypothetical protein EZS28_019059, partial [Streblomastix strix]